MYVVDLYLRSDMPEIGESKVWGGGLRGRVEGGGEAWWVETW